MGSDNSKEVAHYFSSLEFNEDGFVTYNAIVAWIKHYGFAHPTGNAAIQQKTIDLCNKVDDSQDGTISKEELVQYFMKLSQDDLDDFSAKVARGIRQVSHAKIKALFIAVDEDGSKSLDKSELEDWLTGDTELWSGPEAQKLFSGSIREDIWEDIKVNADAEIDSHEFSSYFESWTLQHIDYATKQLNLKAQAGANKGDQEEQKPHKPYKDFYSDESKMKTLELINACSDGNYYDAYKLLALKHVFSPYAADIKYQEPENGSSALMDACSRGFLDIVQLLMHAENIPGGDPRGDDDENEMTPSDFVNLRNYYGVTALVLAVRYGHLFVAQYLIDRQANYSDKDKDGWSLMHIAASMGHIGIVEYLYKLPEGDPHYSKSINPDDRWGHRSATQQTVLGDTPLMLAANNGHLHVVRFLVDKFKQDHLDHRYKTKGLEEVNYSGWSALTGAVYYGRLYVAHYLVAEGCDPDLVDSKNVLHTIGFDPILRNEASDVGRHVCLVDGPNGLGKAPQDGVLTHWLFYSRIPPLKKAKIGKMRLQLQIWRHEVGSDNVYALIGQTAIKSWIVGFNVIELDHKEYIQIKKGDNIGWSKDKRGIICFEKGDDGDNENIRYFQGPSPDINGQLTFAQTKAAEYSVSARIRGTPEDEIEMTPEEIDESTEGSVVSQHSAISLHSMSDTMSVLGTKLEAVDKPEPCARNMEISQMAVMSSGVTRDMADQAIMSGIRARKAAYRYQESIKSRVKAGKVGKSKRDKEFEMDLDIERAILRMRKCEYYIQKAGKSKNRHQFEAAILYLDKACRQINPMQTLLLDEAKKGLAAWELQKEIRVDWAEQKDARALKLDEEKLVQARLHNDLAKAFSNPRDRQKKKQCLEVALHFCDHQGTLDDLETVKDWLKNHKMEKYIPAFESAQCFGEKFLALTDSALMKMGIRDNSCRRKILQRVEEEGYSVELKAINLAMKKSADNELSEQTYFSNPAIIEEEETTGFALW